LEQHRASDSAIRRVPAGWVAALTRPRVATFTALLPGASWAGVLLSLLIGGGLAGLARLAGSGGTGQGPVEAFVGGLVAAWVLFCIQAAYLILATRVLTNPAGQLGLVYTISLFWPLLNVPLLVLAGGGGLSAFGALLWLPATLYGLFLTYLAVQAAPGLSTRGARFVVILPVLLIIILGFVLWGLLLLLGSNLNIAPSQ
jgi:hypothetical protein